MDPNLKTPINQDIEPYPIPTTTTSLRRHRRKTPLRRRKLPYVRLGGHKSRKLALTRLFRRVKLRWLKLKYFYLLMKLKKFYKALIKDIIEGSAGLQTVQNRVFMEASFGIPVMGITI